MKFEKRLHRELQECLPSWRDKFISYKHLKRRLKLLSIHTSPPSIVIDRPASDLPFVDCNVFFVKTVPHRNLGQSAGAIEFGNPQDAFTSSPSTTDAADHAVDTVESPACRKRRRASADKTGFLELLNAELHKLNSFFLEKEEEYVIRSQEIQGKLEEVKGTLGSNSSMSSHMNEVLIQIRKDTVNIHGEIVLLKHYSILNYTGLVKILKKHDRHTGTLLQWPFIKDALHEPFVTTDILTQLLRDCENTFQFLFPYCENYHQQESIFSGAVRKPCSNLGHDVENICRGTIAALRTLKDLRRGSSTYNVFSIPSVEQSQAEEAWSP